jgi:hypothetical protein
MNNSLTLSTPIASAKIIVTKTVTGTILFFLGAGLVVAGLIMLSKE